jgi:hypothetical protein
MKKLLLISVLFAPVAGFAATDQPQNIGYVKTDGPVGFAQYTLAAMNQLTPAASGYFVYVPDALLSKLCVSSGTTKGAWTTAVATGTFVGGLIPHCQ